MAPLGTHRVAEEGEGDEDGAAEAVLFEDPPEESESRQGDNSESLGDSHGTEGALAEVFVDCVLFVRKGFQRPVIFKLIGW